MTLIKSISGIRGTIGGRINDNLTPIDIVKFTAAYGTWLKKYRNKERIKVIVGRDARISGQMVEQIVCGTLQSIGVDVVNAGLATTPTVEIAVTESKSDGGIILTASHNPKEWNALKLLNERGEFISANDGEQILKIAENEDYLFNSVDTLGQISYYDFDDVHINKILTVDLVDVELIRQSKFNIAIDCVNSVGGKILPKLLKKLGVETIYELYCEPNGNFPHNPEPLPENLGSISKLVKEKKADVGFVVDPDVDRLAIICEDGTMFGEEYTLVAVSDYVLSFKLGNTVSNLSSTRALKDITEQYNMKYYASAVGEVNVVQKMKEVNAVIGGEGNGGVIYPALHYGRDALIGIALFLTYLAKKKIKCSELKEQYPQYVISKNKIQLSSGINPDSIIEILKNKYSQKYSINTEDGLKIDLGKEWIHLRKSNTEPIIRIYAESNTLENANKLAKMIEDEVNKITNKE